jgi:hypothetical protein
VIDWSARALAVFRSNSPEPQGVSSVLAVPLEREKPKSTGTPSPEDLSVSSVGLRREGGNPSSEVPSVLAVGSKKEGRSHDPLTAAVEEPIMDGAASRRAAQAEKLLGILEHRQAWSPSDVDDGLDAIARNPEDAAALFLEMLTRLPVDDDDRVRCVDCKHFRYGKCFDFRKAGLSSNDVSRDLATILQRCAAFVHIPTERKLREPRVTCASGISTGVDK